MQEVKLAFSMNYADSIANTAQCGSQNIHSESKTIQPKVPLFVSFDMLFCLFLPALCHLCKQISVLSFCWGSNWIPSKGITRQVRSPQHQPVASQAFRVSNLHRELSWGCVAGRRPRSLEAALLPDSPRKPWIPVSLWTSRLWWRIVKRAHRPPHRTGIVCEKKCSKELLWTRKPLISEVVWESMVSLERKDPKNFLMTRNYPFRHF